MSLSFNPGGNLFHLGKKSLFSCLSLFKSFASLSFLFSFMASDKNWLSVYLRNTECLHVLYTQHNDKDDTIKTTTQFLGKIYLSLYWKGCVWEEVGDRTELQHIDLLTLMAISVSFPFSRAAQPEAPGPSFLLGAGFLYHILSPNSPISKLNRGSRGPLLL